MRMTWLHSSPCIHGQRGFTLIEVLVAVLVLAIGMLGVAGLNAVSLKMNHGAYLRSQATTLAYEMADAMRANRADASDYALTKTAVTCDTGFSRSGSNVATDDTSEWQNRLACLLPSGQGEIVIDTSNGILATVTVYWDETRLQQTASPSTSDESSFTYETEL